MPEQEQNLEINSLTEVIELVKARLEELRFIDYRLNVPKELQEMLEKIKDPVTIGQLLAYRVLDDIFKNVLLSKGEKRKPKTEIEKKKDQYGPPHYYPNAGSAAGKSNELYY